MKKIILVKIMRLLLILIITVFFLLNIRTKEDFITYYLPFYKDDQNLIQPYYLYENQYSDLKHKYGGNLNIIFKDETEDFFRYSYYYYISQLIFSNITVNTAKLDFFHDESQFLKKFNNESIFILSSIYAYKLIQNPIINRDLSFLCNINHKYIFIVSTEIQRMQSSDDLFGKKVAIGNIHQDSYTMAYNLFESSFQYLKSREININFIQESNVDKRFKLLLNNKVNAIIITTLYPSIILDKYITKDFFKILRIIPWNNINEDILQTRFNFIVPKSVDLTLLPKNYLPVYNPTYTVNRPDFKTYCYPISFYSKNTLDNKIGYEIVKQFHKNINLINKSPYLKEYKLRLLEIFRNYFDFPFHSGAKKYLYENNIESNVNNDLCTYYLGKTYCSKEKIEEAKVSLSLL